MDAKGHGGVFESPVNKAALLVKERVNATAVSIYERWRAEDCFYLTGCVGWESGARGPASELKRPEMTADGTWIGPCRACHMCRLRAGPPSARSRRLSGSP
jgi:hypothetical protein